MRVPGGWCLFGEEGQLQRSRRVSHVRSLSCQWARTEEKKGRFVSKDARFGCGRIVLKWRVGRAGRCVEEPKRESTTPRSARSCAPCVRYVHVRCGVRNGEARRLRVPRACVLLSVRVRSRRAGKAKKAQGPPAHHHHHHHPAGACVRACGRACASSDRKERPASCDVAQLARAASPRDGTRLGRTCGGRAERRVTAMKIHYRGNL